VLRHLPRTTDPNLLVGDNPADDAAVYRLRDDFALVQTVDFFTPIVDDPYTFGQIAAANSLSDVYAVGGIPLTALNIVAFPSKTLPLEILTRILQGGADKAAEAGVPIVGGHTVDDEEPKYGLAVTGWVDPAHMITARGAKPGDVLILTKPIGSGVVATALKAGAASASHVGIAVQSMTRLNRTAANLMLHHAAHAATDLTGFGLLGHLRDLCLASDVGATISWSSVPLLAGAVSYAEGGFIPGGTRTNLEFVKNDVAWAAAVSETAQVLLADPQTSGGLLIALPPQAAEAYLQDTPTDMEAAVVGTITESRVPIITVM
jgi:selenide, water dikinase